MKLPFEQILGKELLLFDGAMGTLLQKQGLQGGALAELWNLEKPQVIRAVHRAYAKSGARVHKSNTFGCNTVKFPAGQPLEEIVRAGIANAKYGAGKNGYVALDLGPTGKLPRPLGPLTAQSIADAYTPALRAGAAAGADFVLFETFSDLYEAKCALLCAKESCALPVSISFTFGENSRLLDGATPECCAVLAQSLGAVAVGVNCGFGPEQMLPLLQRMREYTALPLFCNANAGLPTEENGQLCYHVRPAEFAKKSRALLRAGAVLLGGCCGTDPDYIRALHILLSKTALPEKRRKEPPLCICSGKKTVRFCGETVIIGERLNPTGKKKLREAIRTGEDAYLCMEAIAQEDAGADVLDVNVGVPGTDEKSAMAHIIPLLQGVTDLPLQIDSSDPAACEEAMLLYHGVPLLNSVSGKEESLHTLLPLLQKYGGCAVALLLDDNGIPKSAKERLTVADKILARAAQYGIKKERLLFDPLALTVSTGAENAEITLATLRALTRRGYKSVLGVSNVSFGMPNRPLLGSVFLARAMECGLSAAIINPQSPEMQAILAAYRALRGSETGIDAYLAYAKGREDAQDTQNNAAPMTLREAIARGSEELALPLAEKALAETDPLTLISGTLIPALEGVGKEFESGRIFLPELMKSAECAGKISLLCRERMPAGKQKAKPKILLATVQGDIHDIGKNIVKTVLESYGYPVLDLGKDAAPELILAAVRQNGIALVGLSALMTTTTPAMAKTVALLHAKAPGCRVMVGGAVLTQEYADAIGADYYCRDAMESVRVAKAVLQ